MPELAYFLALHSLDQLGSVSLARLINAFGGSAEAAWREPESWLTILKLDGKPRQELLQNQAACQVEKVYDNYLNSGSTVLTLWDESYPALLKEIYDPPPLLFYRGQLPKADDICLAIIGSRDPSNYGRQVAENLSYELAQVGLWVVSGLALGIDGISHRQAIKAAGKTLAVLGSGVDIIYPRQHQKLYDEVIENGAVISEQPLGSQPLPYKFPLRNRIISGLSHGLLVIEAGKKSGTLITVNCALEQGRDVFAVPGPIINPLSYGTNNLLKEGAKIVLEAKDVWSEYLTEPRRLEAPKTQASSPQLAAEEAALLKQMVIPSHFDNLLVLSGWNPAKLAALLTMWEIRGLIRQLPGKYYQATAKALS